MGLFNRKLENKQELETMRSELHTMRQRLDEADAVKARLAEQLGHLDSENQRLTAHVGTVETEVGSVKHHVVTVASSLERQQSAASALPAPAGPTIDELIAKLDELATALATQQRQIADVAVVATDSAERTVAAETAIAANGTSEIRKQIGLLAEKVSTLDARVNQVSLELTNQLTELSGEIDAASGPTSSAADSAAIVQEIERLMSDRVDTQLNDITDGQERLANEQARYAIQFREDLAELAERLRRPTTR